MATLLMKPVSRETLAVTDHPGRKIIVTLEPGDTISFRAKGKRTSYEVPLQACYFLALIYTVNANYRERMKVWKEKKKNGQRCRTPRKISAIFNQMYYEALKIR